VIKRQWTFFSNHGIVLAYIAKSPRSTAQEIAQETFLSVRGVQQIISDLERGNYIAKHRNGRCNQYTIHRQLPLRHRLLSDHTIGEVLQSIGCKPEEVREIPAMDKNQDQIKRG